MLHDPPADPGAARERMVGAEHVLVPFSYSPDEPLGPILAAAAARPGQRFLVTGRVPPGLDAAPPPNVTLTDFVSDADYERLLATAAVVCCLTVNDNTMQRGGYEALAWHKPLVTSDRAVLRDYFGDAAVYCRPDDATSIGEALDAALGHARDVRGADGGASRRAEHLLRGGAAARQGGPRPVLTALAAARRLNRGRPEAAPASRKRKWAGISPARHPPRRRTTRRRPARHPGCG